ncbi:S-layer homology domain-containing protein [Paenibacillus sp.]|uniref:NHL domain-containing protein n=1 Tax=Paenibacillus sp. TaxID=58172 RepID=UPI002811BAA4|nr:S-layer homology domain-containing protein [Paenibacillus sp.]
MLVALAVMLAIGWVPLLPDDWESRAYAADNFTIDTVAGTGVLGNTGDGGPATSAQINTAYHVAVDGDGNLYIPIYLNHVIRKVDTAGNITTVVGTGVEASIFVPSGDGGPATSATLRFPTSVAFDSEGNMYITEIGFERVRKVDKNGTITTVAGSSTGQLGYAGDGGLATSALLNRPVDVAVDHEDNLYIADLFNNVIRKVDTENGIITTVAGNGIAGYSGDGGPAASAQLNTPYAIDFDGSGNMYIADRNNNRVRKVDTSGKISTVAGTGGNFDSGDGGPATAAGLAFPTGITVDDDGTVYVVASNSNTVRKISPTGIITTIAGTGVAGDSGDGGPATSAQLKVPLGIDMDDDGNLYVSDYGNHKIKKLEAVTHTVTFDKNGGDTEATPATLNVRDGETVDALPAPPTRSGFAFAGWNTQTNGGGTVFDATTVVSGDVTVYAQWSENPDAPANLRASPGNGQASLAWDSVTSAVYYSLYIGTASGAYDPLPLTTVTGATYTATGLVNDTTYYFAVRAHNAAGASGFSNEASATPRAPEPSSPPPSPSDSDSGFARPTIQVVDGNDDSLVSNADIIRSTAVDGRRQASIVLTKEQAARAIDKLGAIESVFAKMIIPDDVDGNVKLSVTFPKASADLLSEGEIRMEIAAKQARVVIPDTMFEGVTDGLRFRIEPVWEEDRASIERLATTDPLVLEAARGGKVETVGHPTTIGSNATGDAYEAILPLTGAPLSDEQLKRVAVFALYDDGTKELTRGSIVPYDGGDRLGIRFPVSAGKTGTFAVIRWMHPEHQAFLFGYADGTFVPDRNVTRAEVAAMLVRVFDRDEDTAPGAFPDVGDGHWAREYIDRASGMSLMIGYPDGSFKPDETITRAEMASAIAPLLPEATGASAGFTDTERSWAKAVIEQANAAGIVYGYEDGTFRPNSTLTRAEAVAMLDRLLGRGPLIGAPQQWPDVAQAHWAYGYIQEASMDHSYEKQQDGTEKYIPEP